MPLVQSLIQRDRASAVPRRIQRREEVPKCLRQMRLVILQRQDVVASTVRDLRHSRRLTAHGVDRYHRAFKRQGR